MRRLSVRLDGTNIPLADLAEVLQKTSALLADIEQEITGEGHALRWDVSDLEIGSAYIEVTPHLIKSVPQEDFIINRVVDRFVAGFGLPQNSDETFGFSGKVMQGFASLKRLVNSEVQKLVYTAKDESEGSETSAEIVFDPSAWSSKATVLSDKQPRKYIGSVEGTLETLVGRETYCNIWDRVTGRKIRCDCSKEILAELAEKAWERIVVLTGEIKEGVDGSIKSIKVSRYRVLTPKSEIPKPSDLLGLYVRESNGG